MGDTPNQVVSTASTPGLQWVSAAHSSRRVIASRAVWVALALLTVSLTTLGLGPRYRELQELPPASVADLARVGMRPADYALAQVGMELLVTTAFVLVATLLFWRRSRDPMAPFVAILLLLLGTMNGIVVRAPWAFAASVPAAVPICVALTALTYAILTAFFFVFPDGRFAPRWTGLPAAALVLLACAWVWYARATFLTGHWTATPLLPIGIPMLLALVGVQLYRALRVATPQVRQQTRWVVGGLVAATIGVLESEFFADTSLGVPDPWLLLTLASHFVGAVALAAIPITFAVAVTQDRLFAGDVLLNRALVYTVLTSAVIVSYIVVVGLVGQLFRVSGSWLMSLVATGLIAVGFQPLRQRIQRAVDRLFYGERDEPYRAVTGLGQRLAAALAPEAVLPTIVETVATSLRLPYAAIYLLEDDAFVPAAQYGDDGPSERELQTPPLTLPLRYRNEIVGQLVVAPRDGESDLRSADRALLTELAVQAGAAVSAVRLTAELRRSRHRILAAREVERRRIGRDLHDGLGPMLASIALRIELAYRQLSTRPEDSAKLLRDLDVQVRLAIADIRHLVYDLRPPLLDQFGLIGALRAEAERLSQSDHLVISVQVDPGVPPLPPAGEVAAYRIISECLTNIVRHARARHGVVRVAAQAGWVELTVMDDGQGIPPDRTMGLGLRTMCERAEELGGTLTVTRGELECGIECGIECGTVVIVRLPLE